jgi:hypothetical protein
MANRYWVGGTASWDGTAGSKWALTSGGAGGQAVPTAADDVFFDAASGAVTVTVTAAANCLSLNFSGFTGTLAGVFAIGVVNNVTIASGMTWTHTGALQINGACSFTSNGKTIASGIATNNAATNLTLADALNTTNSITVNFGTFTTNNYSVTAGTFSSNNSNVRTINLGSSTVTLTANSAGVIAFNVTTNLTLNAGTSTIIISDTLGSGVTVGTSGGPAITFNNITFSGAFSGTHSIAGAVATNPSIIINNLAVAAPVSAGVRQLTFAGSCVINGTLSTTGTAGNRRVWFRGATYGIAQTLTVNSAPSLTDADFRDIYVIGTSAPISGTRIGDLRGCSGITFSTPKSVYWVTLAGGNWSGNNWAATSGGGASTDNFPLAQDTAIIENTGLNTSATVTLDTAITYIGTVDMSARTSAMTLSIGTGITVYGDWKNGSGTTLSGGNTITFSGRNTQTITSAGKTFTGSITIDSFGGTVQLADAFNIGANTLTVTNGTFNTQGYTVTASSLSSNNSNVRTITLGASTLTLSATSAAVNFTTSTNLTFNAETSQINCTSIGSATSAILSAIGVTFYNVSSTSSAGVGCQFSGSGNTFNNISITASSAAGITPIQFAGNNTINGTLTCAGATAVRRIFLRSDTLGTTRTLTVNSLSATDCDFRDITIAGAAAGSSPTRAGDCGGNTGITFPAPKTVYWNLAGTNNWTATAWASSSGGSPDINNFPLAQDTAVINDAGAVTQINNSTVNVGTIDFSTRTTAVAFALNGNSIIYGNLTLSSAVTLSGVSGQSFSGRGTTTITSAGKVFLCPITVDCFTGTVQLADALASFSLFLTSGTFNAVTYNVTVGNFTPLASVNTTLRMGSGTWTLTGTGNVWLGSSTAAVLNQGTANIVLSDTSTSARNFNGANFSYNKLTIGGTTGTSTLNITGNNQFTELASTKTVAHTIALSTTTQTFGAWTVSGTAGNVVTVSGTATITIAGARVSGVDYLALGTTVISTTSPGEFYAGANSTGGTNAILTAAPAAVTRYWRGGSGTWDATTTTNWSASSGGAGGASVPTSADAVVFDTLSNATAYTVTCTATQLRCAALTMAGPATGNVTWAGTAPLAVHGNVSLAATGITRSYTGALTLTGSSTGRTFTTNGVALSSATTVNGVGCGWTLGSALNIGSNVFTLTNGTFDTASYAVSIARFVNVAGGNATTLTLGASTITAGSEGLQINGLGFILNAGTSTFNISATSPTFGVLAGDPVTLYNVAFTSTSAGTVDIRGANTFNNLSFTGITSAGVKIVSLTANQTITGTLTFSAGTDATMRSFVRSDTIGTTRTLTCAAFSGTDVDFRDITIAGAAAPVSGTRFGDCKGNSGITFGAGVNKYWNLAGSNNWSATGWATGSGGTPAVNNFPLAQDTAIFEATSPGTGTTTTINASYNIGTINMSARTSNTMTLATGSTTPSIYGNWINGTGTTLSGTGQLTFAGRGSQTITSAGRTFTQGLTIDSPSGTVTLQDAFVSNRASTLAINLAQGTFNAGNYNVTLSDASSGVNASSSGTKTLGIGSGTWVVAGSGTSWSVQTGTITGSGTVSMTSASAKNFSGSGLSYSGVTLNQGGAGALTILGDNTFKDITNTYSATGATNITLGTTTQRVTQFTGTGAASRVLTIQGTSASSPGTLILTGATKPNVDYLAITGVRAYSLTDTWYAGANSTNNGSLGWIFASGVVVITGLITEGASGLDSLDIGGTFNTAISEVASALENLGVGGTFNIAISEVASALENLGVGGTFNIAVSEIASGLDSTNYAIVISAIVNEAASGVDSINYAAVISTIISEVASALEILNTTLTFTLSVSEAASGLDSLAPNTILNTIVNEITSALETLNTTGTFSISVSEAALGQEQLSSTAIFVVTITETSTSTDILTARFLWELIDNQQNANWIVIPTP